MKPIKPKYKGKVPVELKISDRSNEILKRYAEFTKFTPDEIVDKMITEIIEDDRDFVEYLNKQRYQKKIKAIIFQGTSRPSSEGRYHEKTDKETFWL